ncbi:GntR family transcriptional regulator [Bdellovibrio bacteriovorus]|uniref:GntR family transcriptional regulator n=1 Tax=Bdellovibrio bacteriovorus TaxID=959 RepID=A0A150WH12_BDEBC|nr:S1-like domain-containing RNA-binding protein [Bdellovibrio bacteriovorus]KYG62414.1 GntR family transcriptional regulator [Bdellovibrio bacteriovorus]
MLDLGHIQKLKIVEIIERGAYLDDGHGNEVLLPLKEVPPDSQQGQELEVFIYRDSEDRLIATLDRPFVEVGAFASLKVKSVDKVGAFLDWGLPKDLFLPFSEQTRDLIPGQYVTVAVYIDNSDRIAASMRWDRHLSKEPAIYKANQAVSLVIMGRTDLGYKALVEGKHSGMLYANEVFERLDIGQKINGFVKQVRPDGKIDLLMQAMGNFGTSDLSVKILEALKAKGGFLPVTDKTDPEEIYRLFGVSKKKYKMALGGLYKKRQIAIEDNGIRLIKA